MPTRHARAPAAPCSPRPWHRPRAAGLRRVWLVTTNDNLDALRFYQRRGLRIAAVHPGAVDRSRAVKPTIPLVDAYGIPLRDELIMELRLDGDPDTDTR